MNGYRLFYSFLPYRFFAIAPPRYSGDWDNGPVYKGTLKKISILDEVALTVRKKSGKQYTIFYFYPFLILTVKKINF
jgi:hypothetical protein